MTFPPGSMPAIPADPVRGAMNWDGPLNAKLDALTSATTQAWQNIVDSATAISVRGITPTVNSANEIANPVDGQLTYVQESRTYLRWDAIQVAWVPFLQSGANGQFINTFRGAWSAVTYAAGSIVTSAGSSWIATSAVSGTQVPGTDSAWAQIAASGAPGTAGNTVLNGTTNPTSGQGNNGDFYLNTSTNVLWGPKASGAWPGSGTSIIGPTGSAGPGVITGGTSGQYYKKNSSTNYDGVWGAVVDADISGLTSVTSKAVDSSVVHLAGAESITGVKTFTANPVFNAAGIPQSAISGLSTSLAALLPLAGGTMTGAIAYTGGANSTIGSQSQVTGDTQQRFTRRLDGQMGWGSGSVATDTNLRRSAAATLATDNQFASVQGIQVGGATASFGGGVGVIGLANASTAPTTNPTGGGVLYADSSSRPTWRDANGNVWSLVPDGDPAPADQGLLGWTYQPQLANQSAPAITAGVIYLARITLRSATTVTNANFTINTAGSGLSNSWIGLYDSTGTRQALTADVSTILQSTGFKTTIAFTSTYAAAAGNYWLAFLVGAGTTLPQFAATYTSTLTAGTANAGLGATTARWATNGTAQTSLPATITPGSNSLSNQTIWAALT